MDARTDIEARGLLLVYAVMSTPMRRAARTVRDIMSREVVTFAPDTPLHDAMATLADRQISGAPVCAEDGTALGVVTASDLVDSCAAGSRATRVRQIMTPVVFSVGADDAIAHAIDLMAFEGVHRVVVLEEGHVVGIVTSMDVLRELAGYEREGARVMAVAPPEADAP